MGIDTDKIDEAVLALLQLTRHDVPGRVERPRLGRIRPFMQQRNDYDLLGKVKSVVLTDEGLAESACLFRKRFAKSAS